MPPKRVARTTAGSSSTSSPATNQRSRRTVMRRAAWLLSAASLAVSTLGVRVATAAPALRVQVSQNGDLTWIGNTSAQECAATARAPVVGTVGNCGAFTGDSAPDVFWRSDDPAAGQARARVQNTAAQARSTAVLTLPPGAT